jgi:hypothetical protein
MEDLIRNEDYLAKSSAQRDPAHIPTPAEREDIDHALSMRNHLRERLHTLDNRHAMLMHGSVLADAEDAAEAAKYQLMVAAGQSTQPPPSPWDWEAHKVFVAELEAGEQRIADVLADQRQLTRDALAELFPKLSGPYGLHTLRFDVVERAGLGVEEYNRAREAINTARRRLTDLESRFRRGLADFGNRPVTHTDVERERDTVQAAVQHFDDLNISRPITWRAMKAMDSVEGLTASSSIGLATRAARIAEKSRERAQQSTAPAAKPLRCAAGNDQHAHHLRRPGTGQTARLS